MTGDEAVRLLVAERPAFHLGGACVWNALPQTLGLIARHVRRGDRTVETGCGASTVVFAAAGAHHTAVSPSADEHERVRAWCREHGIADGELAFVAGTSDAVLPTLAAESLDVAFIDGKHSFPFPVVDWHYLAAALRLGGILIVDDLPIPAVATVARHMQVDPAWDLLEIGDNRAGVYRKVGRPERHDDWEAQPFNAGYPDYSFLPPTRRLALKADHAARRARRRLGERVPALRRLWRATPLGRGPGG